MMLHKDYQGSHFDYLRHSSVNTFFKKINVFFDIKVYHAGAMRTIFTYFNTPGSSFNRIIIKS